MLSADVIMLMVDQANHDLSVWGERIFGRVEDNRQKQPVIPQGLGEMNAKEYAQASEDTAFKAENEAYQKRIKDLKEKGYDKLSDKEKQEYQDLLNKTVTVRDGELGAHIGYAPIMKSEPDYKKSAQSNIESPGTGQMGMIMLDSRWNDMKNTNGYAVYGQLIWNYHFTHRNLKDGPYRYELPKNVKNGVIPIPLFSDIKTIEGQAIFAEDFSYFHNKNTHMNS